MPTRYPPMSARLIHVDDSLPGIGRERLADDPLSGAVNPDIGDGVEPVDELSVEVVEAAEAAAEKEVLTDIAERSLDLSLRFGPTRPAGAGLEAIMPRQRNQRLVVGDVTVVVLAGHPVFMRS